MSIDPVAAALAIAGILIGGILKGATGAGAPIVAVPMLALALDVPAAVAIFSIPNLLSNVVQGWQYRTHALGQGFTLVFSLAGLAGAVAGTFMLVALPAPALVLSVSVCVFAYIAFRLARPGWQLRFGPARRIATPVGFIAGILQGAVGISAPVSVSFLNAMKLERAQFVGTISAFFLAMSVVQVPLLAALGVMTLELFLFGLGALALLFLAMPAGAWLARRISREAFDRLILLLLALVALRLAMTAVG